MKLKRLNYILASGLCVVSARFKGNTKVAALCITNFAQNTRILFDVESKKVLANKDNIVINAKDVDGLLFALTGKSEEEIWLGKKVKAR
jgi:hypothetical protein